MKKFLVTKKQSERLDFVNAIDGKKICIYSKHSDLVELFDYAIDMNKLMDNEYFLEQILKCDSNTTLVLIDVLVKNGVYVHPYGKVFRFTELAKTTLMIDTFMFKYTEKNIVRPFLFIDTSVFGTSMLGFHQGEQNTIENYYKQIAPHIDCKVSPININVIRYEPTPTEIEGYNALKKAMIADVKNTKAKIVNALINYVDALASKKQAIANTHTRGLVITSNKPKNKFTMYEKLASESIGSITFFSSGLFGADELQLKESMQAIDRHNKLIKLLNENV